MTPEEVAHAAQQEFLWKGVTGVVSALSVAVVALFGWVMRSKDNHITRSDSKIELLERQAIERDEKYRAREEKIRADYEAKLEELRKDKSRQVRHRARAARLAEEALRFQEGRDPVPDESFDDEEDENTEIRDVRAESRETRVQDELRRLKDAARREKERVDRQARAYVRGEPQPSSVPPAKPYRDRLPSRRG